jgi:chromosome segregation ATPase
MEEIEREKDHTIEAAEAEEEDLIEQENELSAQLDSHTKTIRQLRASIEEMETANKETQASIETMKAEQGDLVALNRQLKELQKQNQILRATHHTKDSELKDCNR